MLNHGLLIQLGQRSPKPGREKRLSSLMTALAIELFRLRESLRRRQCLLSVRKTGVLPQRETRRSNSARGITFNGWMPMISCRPTKSQNKSKQLKNAGTIAGFTRRLGDTSCIGLLALSFVHL